MSRKHCKQIQNTTTLRIHVLFWYELLRIEQENIGTDVDFMK